MALLDFPSPASRQIRDRSTILWGVVLARIHASNVPFCSAVIGNTLAGFHIKRTVPQPVLIVKILLLQYTRLSSGDEQFQDRSKEFLEKLCTLVASKFELVEGPIIKGAVKESHLGRGVITIITTNKFTDIVSDPAEMTDPKIYVFTKKLSFLDGGDQNC